MQILFAQTGSDSTNSFFQIVAQKDAYYDSLINVRGVDSMQGTGYTGYLRWKAFMTPRIDDTGTIAGYANVISNYYSQASSRNFTSNNFNWNYFAPTGAAIYNNEAFYKDKGWVNRLYYDDANNIIYAGTHNNGIWKTSNMGNDWTCITLSEPKINGIVGLVKIDNTIYALTYSNIGGYYNGLYKSNDEGANWDYVEVEINGDDFYGTGVKWEKRPIRLIGRKAGSNHELYLLANNYVLKSTDGGANWDEELHKPGKYQHESGENENDYFYRKNDEGFEDIIFDKNNPNLVIVSGTQIMRSTNAGALGTWNDITFDVTGLSKVTTCKMDNNAMNTENVWFLYVYGEPDNQKAHIKHMYPDGSGGFVYQDFGSEIDFSGEINFRRAKINIKVDPNNINKIYTGGLSLYQMRETDHPYIITDYATQNTPNRMHADIRDMLVYPGGGNLTFLTACDGGVVKAWFTGEYNNDFEIWNTEYLTIKNGSELNISEVYALDVKDKNNDCYFNCQDIGGFYKNGNKLYKFQIGDGGAVTFDKVYNYVYYSDNQWGQMSGTNLNNFESIGFYINWARDLYFYPTIVQTPGNPKVTYFGLKKLYRFDDIYEYINSNSQEAVPFVESLDNTYIDGDGNVQYYAITDVAISENNPDIMYVSTKKTYWWDGNPPDASTYTGGLFKSTDGGQTWSDISAGQKGMFSGFITDIELNPFNDDELWLTYGYATSSSYNGYTRKVYRYYKDNNNNWVTEPYSFNLPDKLPVNQMVTDKFTGDKYIATDVGVFKWNNNDSQWDNISINNNSNMLKMATDIKINYQTRKMFVSTFGAGIWEADLNDCPQYSGNVTQITGQEDWYGTKQVNGDVVVENGGELTIHGTVYFNENSKVTVKTGGKLTLDGAKLTNNCSGNSWQGIQVWGNKYAVQNPTTQGWIVLKNNAVIENAITAVYLGKPDGTEYAYGYGGGILEATNTVFRNNITAVYVEPYSYNSVSGLAKCDFITDNNYEHNAPPKDFVNINDYSYFDVFGCTFINRNTNGYKNSGNGITAYNSTLVVKQSMLNDKPVLNKFSGLQRGIDYSISNSYKTIRVENSDFDNNVTGIYVSGASNIHIDLNNFIIRPITNNCGLYLDNCPAGYTVEENSFEGTVLPDENSSNYYGLIINNSGPEEKMIYNNYFEKLYYGAQAQYVNRNSGNNVTGLVFKCNDFRTNIYDITVLDPKKNAYDTDGIKFYQGEESNSNEPREFWGANNTFTYEGKYPGDGGFKPHKYDLYNSLNAFYYYYPTGIFNKDSKTEPSFNYYTLSTVVPEHIIQTEYDKETYCPSHLSNGGGGLETTGGISGNRNLLNVYNGKIDSLKNQLTLVTDGGNTSATLLTVNSAQTSNGVQVRNMLLQKSPYLSDTVIKATVWNETAFTPAMVRDVLVENPQSAKLLSVGYALDQRTDTLTGYMRSQIDAGLDTLGALELLRAQLAFYRQKQTEVLGKLCWLYNTDTTVVNVADSMIMLYNLSGEINYKYRAAMVFLQLNDTLAADSVMSHIALNHNFNTAEQQEYNNMQLLFAIWKNMLSDSLWLPDSSYLSALSNIAGYGTGTPAVYARNMLLRMGAYNYNEPYLTVDTTQLKAGGDKGYEPAIANLLQNSCRLLLFPNPAGNYFTVDYKVAESTSSVYLEIAGINGKILKTVPLYQTEDQKIIETRQLPSGVYTVTLFANGIKAKSSKLIVIK